MWGMACFFRAPLSPRPETISQASTGPVFQFKTPYKDNFDQVSLGLGPQGQNPARRLRPLESHQNEGLPAAAVAPGSRRALWGDCRRANSQRDRQRAFPPGARCAHSNAAWPPRRVITAQKPGCIRIKHLTGFGRGLFCFI